MADKATYSINCSDGGMACDFHVCDSSKDEVIAAAQDHARRVHGKQVSADDLGPLIKSGANACK